MTTLSRDLVLGRLTLLSAEPRTPAGPVYWLCKCQCGTVKTVRSDHLTSGKTRSCGCLRDDLHSKLNQQTFPPKGGI